VPDELTDVIKDLDSLRSGTIKAGIEFQGFTKKITQVAAGTEGASKSWTTFSRLVSGTPLWAFQNKLRAYLSILAGFEKRSDANAKAMDKEAKQTIQKIKGYKELNKIMSAVTKNEKNLLTMQESEAKLKARSTKQQKIQSDAQDRYNDLRDELNDLEKEYVRNAQDSLKHRIKFTNAESKLNKEMAKQQTIIDTSIVKYKNLQSVINDVSEANIEALKNTAQYQQVLLATGSEEKAMARSIDFFKQRNKLVLKEEQTLIKQAKLAYAYDKTRIKEAKALSKLQGKGRIGQFFAGRSERKSMRKDQSSALKTAKGDAGSAIYGGVKENLKNAKMLLAPLLVVTKSAKAIYSAVNPMSSGAKKFRTKMYKIIEKLQPIFSLVFKYLIMGMLAIAGFFVILMFMKRYYAILQEFGVIDEIKELGKLAFDFIKTGWKAISAFISGDYQKALDHLTVFVDKGIVLLIKTGKILAKMAFLALVAGFELLMDAVYKFYKDPAFRKQVMGILMKVALVVVGLIVVQFLIGVALSIAAAFALPILLGVVILAALYTVARWLDNKFGDYYQNIEDTIYDIFNMVYTVFNDAYNAIIYIKDGIVDKVIEAYQILKDFYSFGEKKEKARAWIKTTTEKIIDLAMKLYNFLTGEKVKEKVQAGRDKYNAIKKSFTEKGIEQTIRNSYKSGMLSALPKFANGGTSSGGMALVGELGPELVRLNRGDKVFSNAQSRNMIGNTNIHITINAKDTSKAEMRRIANELGTMINNKMSRTGATRTMR
jgi:hypothetical protein